MPPLRRSDHNLVHVPLGPTYKPMTLRVPPKKREVMSWTNEAVDKLRACLECTDWTVFTESAENVNKAADVVSAYINLCVEQCTPKKTILYSNNKPWLTKEVKESSN
ncbi:hypothetical protein ElyMa_006452300 [Elysia marginata]|uniref:Uncharacterized protein n=1 Tax=Elysia marginata TaxID=1093978 RepID=A0AAV4I0T0_9GAST|nr:hypothetical protein ElyMa_006452300 [Elysia marginata]